MYCQVFAKAALISQMGPMYLLAAKTFFATNVFDVMGNKKRLMGNWGTGEQECFFFKHMDTLDMVNSSDRVNWDKVNLVNCVQIFTSFHGVDV